MIAEIVAIGTELLMGQIVNTDAQFLSRRLSALGVTVYRHVTVGDNPGRVQEAIRQEDACLSLRDLAIDGHDLMALGYTGRAIGTCLNRLLELVLDEQLPNEREALIHYLTISALEDHP